LLVLVGCDRRPAAGTDAGAGPPWPRSCGDARAACASVLVTAPDGEPAACRLSVEGLDGTASPSWGTSDHVGDWIAGDVVAVGQFVLAPRCTFDLALAPGRYRLTASRGPGWSIASAIVDARAGETSPVHLDIEPAIELRGFACADFHVHSAPSFDSDVPLDQRLVSALAEGLDVIAATDHDARGDWEPPAADLGIGTELLVLVGNEITPDQGAGPRALGHFNVYPVPEDVPADGFDLALGGADAVLANARGLAPDAVLQVNHPRWNEWIGYFTVIDFDPRIADGRRAALSTAFDAIEVYNGHELSRGGPTDVEANLRDWYALLNRGVRVVATGNSDTHRLARAPLGFPRTCVRVDRAPGAALDADALLASLRAGAAIVTSGPWIEASIEGQGPGGLAPMRASGSALELRLTAPSWAAVDRFAVIVNGRVQVEREIGGLPYEDIVIVEEPRDAWVVVRAEGDAPLGIAAGRPAHPMRSLAFTNPIFVDRDGDGAWTPPGL
jgi:hypothetical protein